MDKHTGLEKGSFGASLSFSSSPDGLLLVRLMGDWKIGNPLPSADELEKKLTAGARVKRVGFDSSELKAWDSGLLTFLTKVKEVCSYRIRFNWKQKAFRKGRGVS